MTRSTNYFAFGSNLHPACFQQRIGQRLSGSVAILQGAKLRFNKRGMDGSGKCNIEMTDSKSDTVIGVVYKLSVKQASRIDQWESDTCHYQRFTAEIELDGRAVEIFSYYASDPWVDSKLLPWVWYKKFVVSGALYFGLPKDYIKWLNGQPAISDSDVQRAREKTKLLTELDSATINTNTIGERTSGSSTNG